MTPTKDELKSIFNLLKSKEKENVFLGLNYLSIIDDFNNNSYLRSCSDTAKFVLKGNEMDIFSDFINELHFLSIAKTLLFAIIYY